MYCKHVLDDDLINHLNLIVFNDRVEFGKLAVDNQALNLGQVINVCYQVPYMYNV